MLAAATYGPAICSQLHLIVSAYIPVHDSILLLGAFVLPLVRRKRDGCPEKEVKSGVER